MSSIFKQILASHQNNLPFVSFRKPNSKKIHTYICEDSSITYSESYKEEGFVFAPFHNVNPSIIFLKSKSKIYEDEPKERTFILDSFSRVQAFSIPNEIILPFKKQLGESALFGIIKDWKFTGFTGFASHGAAIGIIFTMYFYAKKHLQKSWLFILDRLAIMVALAGFFIRSGNFFNSEIYGKETGSNFGVIFKAAGETTARHPTQLYEAFSYLILFFVMWHLYWKTDKKQQREIQHCGGCHNACTLK